MLATTALFAMARIQGRTIAIPSAYVTQAVEAPPELMQVPRRAGAIEGVMALGRRVIPVISLARWIAPAAGAGCGDDTAIQRAHGLVLLLKDGDACIGLAIDAVIGTQRIPVDQVRRLFHDENADELFQSAALFGNDEVPTSILEPARLMALARVWADDGAVDARGAGCTSGEASGETCEETSEEAGAVAARAAVVQATAPGAQALSYGTFRIADAHIALPAQNIGELLRRPPLRNELPPYDGVMGLCEWRERLVPVVDLTSALHAVPAGDTAAWVCIVCEGDLAIGLVMHEVLDIARVTPDAGTPERAPESERTVVARRLIADERTLQIIDVAALLRRYAEAAISVKGARATALRAKADPSAPAYMVFDAQGMFAARIDGVQDVVRLPDELRLRLDAGLPTTLQWRNQPVPIIAIADSLVAMPMQSAHQLVVVRQDERFAALAIAGVKAMVPRGTAQRHRIRMQGRPVEVISVDTEDHRASYPLVELGVEPQTLH